MPQTPDVPNQASVVVIGGGIMGCSTLYHLARSGVDAVLLERNRLTSGTTWHSAAQVRALRSSRNLTRMIQYSVDLYGRLEEQTGQSVGWIQKGSLSLATTPDRLTMIKRQEALAHAYGIAAASVSRDEARERWPLMNADDVIGAVWSPEDGRVSPSDVCAALAKGARASGAKIFEGTGVTGILTEAGRIAGVETARGVIRCDAVALCAGLWSREVGQMAGADVPLWPCEHFYLLTKPVPGITGNMPTLSDHDNHLYIRDDSGGLLVGCFEPMGKAIPPGVLTKDFAFGLLPEDWDHFEPMMRNALHRLPALETAEVKMLLNGPESFTPDGAFMLGEAAETPGLFLGCGMNSMGVAAGGGAGMNLAHLITQGHAAYDLSEAEAKRFAPVFNSVDHLMARAPEILGTHYQIAYPGRQLSTGRNLRKLPLHDHYTSAGASLGQFYGWERPLYFARQSARQIADAKPTFGRPGYFNEIKAEALNAQGGVALFDLSPFGKIDVKGPDAEAYLLRVCSGYMSRPPGSVIYTAMLNARGTFESDLTAQRIAADHYRLFVGTTAIKRDFAWLRNHLDGFDVTIEDTTEKYATLALMGPEAARVVAQTGAPELNALGYFKVGPAHIAGKHVRAARISYVGEAGWEISMLWENAAPIYAALTAAGARPAGLYAQTSLRIEKGFCAMGHELDSDVTPFDVGLGFAVRKGGFIGAEALDRDAPNRLISLIFDDDNAVPLGHEPIYAQGKIVGQTTSAGYGFRIGAPIALGLANGLSDGQSVEVDIARQLFGAKVKIGAAYDPAGSRMKV